MEKRSAYAGPEHQDELWDPKRSVRQNSATVNVEATPCPEAVNISPAAAIKWSQAWITDEKY
jgi:hypothetical protein